MKHVAMFYKPLRDNTLECFLCRHKCVIPDNRSGICKQRKNINGVLYTYAYANIVAAHIDPIEKKPLYCFHPGTKAFSIAMPGCNFKCGFCQNWQISQPKEDQKIPTTQCLPKDIVEQAIASGCESIAYTYTEPTIFFEYSYDTARIARERGLYNVYVTNGYMGKEALEAISPYLDAANVDLKSFRDGFYRDMCQGGLEPVLETIKAMKSYGIWVEVTTLLVPGMNDSKKELTDIANFIAGIDKDMPWHISRFHPDFMLQDRPYTSIGSMESAMGIGKDAGLRHVYLGNV
jgi:pyruvate formate lyase activating enzyme